MKEEYC